MPHPELEKSFYERYWAAQNRHLAVARRERARLLCEQADRALERSNLLIRKSPEMESVKPSSHRIAGIRLQKTA